MEKTLLKLFDYQKFEGNSRLDRMIADTEARYGFGEEISDDALDMVSAAGALDRELPEGFPEIKNGDF